MAASHYECHTVRICNMLLSSLCHAELLKSDWLEGGWQGVGRKEGNTFIKAAKFSVGTEVS